MTNPIIPGFYPDPSICRGPDAYYTAHSSIEYGPGIPIFRSTDLLNWTQIGNALDRDSQLTPGGGQSNSGIYAPTIRYQDGLFWLITTNIGEIQHGQLLVSSPDPAGPWSDPVHISGAVGIDPDLSWDDEGQCHLTWASADPRHEGLTTAIIDPSNGALLSEPSAVWQGSGVWAPEGPHLYQLDGWWYQLIAEGGTERGHMAAIARARSLEGPWETNPNNPILTHRSTGHAVQNVGHADLVETFDGNWAMVYHGVRPRGGGHKFHVNGRETFIAGIDWVEGWPVVDEDRYQPAAHDHSFSDHFDADTLDMRWVAPGVNPSSLVQRAEDGVTLSAAKAFPGGRALIGVRPRDDEWSFSARLTVQGVGRLVLRIDDDRWYALTITHTSVEATLAIGPAMTTVEQRSRQSGSDVSVRISSKQPVQTAPGSRDQPDVVELAVTDEQGHEHVFGAFDGRYLSTEVSASFTGRVVGIEAVEGTVTVHEVEYTTDHEKVNAGPDGSRYDLDSTRIGTLFNDPEALAIINKIVPTLAEHPFVEHMKAMPLSALAMGQVVESDDLDKLRSELATLRAPSR